MQIYEIELIEFYDTIFVLHLNRISAPNNRCLEMV